MEVYHEQRGGEDGRCHPLDARREQIEGWRGVEYSATTVRRYIHRHFPPPVRPVMRRETKPGEVMEVDFGHLGLTWDAATRSRKRTWVCAGRLRHSRRAFRDVVLDQKQEAFFACHMHAFEWFGGGHRRVVRGPVGEPRLSRTRAALRVPDFALSSTSRGTSCRCSARPRRSAGATPPTPASWGRLADKYTTKRLGRPDAARCTSPRRVSRHAAHRRGGTARLRAARAPTHQERLGSGQDPRADPARTGYLPLRAAIGKSHAAQALGHSTGSTPVAATVPTSAGCAKSAP